MFVMFCSYSLSYWYGSVLIEQGKINAGKIMTVFLSVLIGAMSIGQASPSITSFASGRGAATKIFEMIDRKSKINPLNDSGGKPSFVSGQIEFKNIKVMKK